MNEYLLEPGQLFCFKLIRRQHGSNRNNLAAKIGMQKCYCKMKNLTLITRTDEPIVTLKLQNP